MTPTHLCGFPIASLPDNLTVHNVEIGGKLPMLAGQVTAPHQPLAVDQFMLEFGDAFHGRAFATDLDVVRSTTLCVTEYADGDVNMTLMCATKNDLREMSGVVTVPPSHARTYGESCATAFCQMAQHGVQLDSSAEFYGFNLNRR